MKLDNVQKLEQSVADCVNYTASLKCCDWPAGSCLPVTMWHSISQCGFLNAFFPPKGVTILQLWLLFCGFVTHTVTDSSVRHKVTNDETSQIVICSGGSQCHKSCIFVCVLIRIIETMTLNDAMHLCGISLMKSLSCHSHPKVWTLSSWSLFWVPYIQRSECCAYIFISHSCITYS